MHIVQGKANLETGEATDELEEGTKRWVASLGSDATTISAIVKTKDPLVTLTQDL